MFSKKSFVAGLIAGCVISGGVTVFAGQSISAIVSGSHFKFNGVEKQLPSGYVTIGYNGHTYVPARFVAEQLGANVGWEASTSTVTIDSAANSGGSNVTPSPTSAVKIVSVVSPVHRNGVETVVAHVPPGTTASIEVDYKSGPSQAAGLDEKTADASGNVSWSFKVGGNTTLGSWPVTVSDNGASDKAYFEVVQ
ncbi:MAG: stalk domain-containing protein [Tumebacillaceae bacterium]